MTEAPPHIVVETDGALTTITLNRPERRNALVGPMVDDLRQALVHLDQSDAVGVIVLRGAGGVFCAGMDLKERQAVPPPAWLETFSESWAALNEALFDLSVTTVCALEGAAVGGGAALALGCDFIVAGESAKMHAPEVRAGIGAAPAVLAWALWRHGPAFAAHLVLASDPIPAADLHRAGIVQEAVPDHEVHPRTVALAAHLAERDARVSRAAKRLLRTSTPRPDFRRRT